MIDRLVQTQIVATYKRLVTSHACATRLLDWGKKRLQHHHHRETPIINPGQQKQWPRVICLSYTVTDKFIWREGPNNYSGEDEYKPDLPSKDLCLA